MFAPVVLLIGIYKVMQTMSLTNTLLGLVFINAAFNQAFTIWLLRGTFMSISAEMEQAATIDGCNRLQSMFKVLLPMAAPGIVTTLIFIFINAWNEYTVALCLISTDTLVTYLYKLAFYNAKQGEAAAVSVIGFTILLLCASVYMISTLKKGDE